MKTARLTSWTRRVLGLYQHKDFKLRYLTWGLTALALLSIYYLIFSLSYLDRVYPGVVIGTERFSGLTKAEVLNKVTELTKAQTDRQISVSIEDSEYKIAPSEIELQVNVAQTVSQIFDYGRLPTDRFTSFFEQISSPFIKHRVRAAINFDTQFMETKISEIADLVDKRAVDAKGEIISDQLVLTKEEAGLVIDQEDVSKKVITSLESFSADSLTFSRHLQQPSIFLGDEEVLRTEVDRFSQRKLKLSWPTGNKVLTKKEIKQLIGFIGDQTSQPNLLVAEFTDQQIQSYLTSIADRTDSPAVDPLLVIDNGVLVVSKKSKEGSVVDLTTSSGLIMAALNSEEDQPTVDLVMKAQTPVITEDNLDSLGIKERIGFGETSFTGSPVNRRHNISNGIVLMQSALIKPGEEFSTVKALGAVDNTTGFLPELVIKENRTVPEYGGGLCQVSTTLFRSVMNAGLKVTERQNHSYRVSYYEPPVGLDATIYLPKPDFKFLNDTNAHILVQGRVVGNKVIFELWGTNDGRISSISTPQILSTTPAGEPIYADTDTLPKGEQKQIEKAHDGAVAIAYYTVTRNGEVINKQTFKSFYKPWPARFLVGTNESLPPSTP